ncbi:MAG: helix-turn-helix domain-containing protein [Bacteroidia bacterium]
MSLGKELLFFFSALGVFNGLLLSGYFLFLSKEKSKANYFLATLLLALCMRIGKSILYYFDPTLPKIYLQIGLTGCLFIGPLLLLYIRSSLKPTKRVDAFEVGTLLIWALVAIIGGSLYPYQSFSSLWNQYIVWGIYWQWLIYLLWTTYALWPLIVQALTQYKSLDQAQKWLISVFVGNVLVHLAYRLVPFTPYLSGALIFSSLSYLLGLLYFSRLRTKTQRSSRKKIILTEAKPIKLALERLMTEEHLYKQANLKLPDLAQKLGISPHLLSQFLNENLQQSFSQYINEYRVAAAERLFETHDHFTLEAIGFEAGFSSKSTFYATYKKLRGQTPAAYKKALTSTPEL